MVDGEHRIKVSQTAVKLTIAQQLGSLIKSARDIMRKDKGLDAEVDPLLRTVFVTRGPSP